MALQLLLWLGVVLFTIVALFVLLPIRIVMSWQSDPAKPTTLLLGPFGGVSPLIKVYDSTRKRIPKPKKPRAKARRPQRKARGPRLKMRGNAVAEFLRLLGRLLEAVQIEKIRGDLVFGLGDPAETGQLYGQLCPLVYTTGGHVHLRPDFEVACLSGAALAQLRVWPIGVIWPFVSFGWRVFGPLR